MRRWVGRWGRVFPRLPSESGTSIVSAIPGGAWCEPFVPALGRLGSSTSTHWCPHSGVDRARTGGVRPDRRGRARH